MTQTQTITQTISRPAVDDTVTPDSGIVHVVCGQDDDTRTVPMYAVCGTDITFDPAVESDPTCKECIALWPTHAEICPPEGPCRIQLA